jgi:Z1 domain
VTDTATPDVLVAIYTSVLDGMKKSGPKTLRPRLELEAQEAGASDAADEGVVLAHLQAAHLDDPLRRRIHLALADWDFAPTSADWVNATEANTEERRAAIYTALGLSDDACALLDTLAPFATDGTVIISRDFEHWYADDVKAERAFYWSSYEGYLAARGLAPDAIASLDASTTRVMERLARPTRDEAYQGKGLVVGYVQSGKTANFTGVIAKAVDAGYRLVIVLTGTTNLLRSQTQRRLDKELLGVENILRGINPDDAESLAAADYQADPDWVEGTFARHGVPPSDVGRPDILRLTTYNADYKRLAQGITTLDLEHRDKTRPLFDADNLFQTNARLIVVKKNKAPLKKFVADLKKITANLGEIPTLIVDDESDQASINTTDPEKWKEGVKDRTVINDLISQLLGLLPRAQYVAYTATPFANVFVDPTDASDIFPRDFMFSLDRPPGYMGARDFHDLDNPIPLEDRTFANSNEIAYVRAITTEDGDAGRLREALDMFVLTGAVKLYREDHGLGAGHFRHHTMLIHQSVKVSEHAELANTVRSLWQSSAYTGVVGLERLKKLYVEDLVPVSEVRAPDVATLVDFEELKPYIAKAIHKIDSGTENPVVVVNSEHDQAAVDFERQPIWKCLVGGTKLSRGFTVEGLTVSYYRRKTDQADTLMQMGRWFGFRQNYEDLVRLYIGRTEGHAGTFDLYAAFEAACRSEERFREQLRQYAKLENGKPQITPKEIPPLVTQHLPWLRPAAKNKMFNAELVERRSPGAPLEPVGYPEIREKIAANTRAFEPLIECASTSERLKYVGPAGTIAYDALAGKVSHDQLIEVLEKLVWLPDDYFTPDLNWLKGLKPTEVDEWVVLLPQHTAKGPRATILGHGPLSVFARKRRRGTLFGAISDPKHRFSARRIAGAIEPFGDETAERLHGPRTGAFIVYPVVEGEKESEVPDELDPEQVVTAFVAVAPITSRPPDGRLVTFRVRDKDHEDEAIIDA